MATISGGEFLARCLAAEGVAFAFGLPCPELDPLLAALEPNGIRFVPIRHEAAAAHMAEGLYKTTGGVAAVLGNPGPGSANLLPGIITAMIFTSVPEYPTQFSKCRPRKNRSSSACRYSRSVVSFWRVGL